MWAYIPFSANEVIATLTHRHASLTEANLNSCWAWLDKTSQSSYNYNVTTLRKLSLFYPVGTCNTRELCLKHLMSCK